MTSDRRLKKINILLKEEVASILNLGSEFRCDALVTVTRAEAAPDLSSAVIFISILDKEPKEVLQNLQKHVYNIQQMLNKRLRIRSVPKIRFVLDADEFRREKIEKSLAELKRQGGI